MRITKERQNLYGAWTISSVALCCLLAAGCNKTEEAPSGPSGPPAGGMGGGPGRMGPGGGMGGPGGRGGPIAADASGADIVSSKCGCHGPGGAGGKAPNLTNLSSRSDSDLIAIIHDGKGKMPAFGSQLTDEQIIKVVTYLKGLKPSS
jgi:hypothetical protein